MTSVHAAEVGYVHGYTPAEVQRLNDQARTLEDLFHHDTTYPPGARVLEAGCGVGAQTVALARRSPGARFTCIDVSPSSVALAAQAAAAAGLTNVSFEVADIFALPFAPATFDHVFVCFVLEHLAEPALALSRLRDMVRPGGTLTAIEGDHRSTQLYPESAAALEAVECLCELQRRSGGDANLGRRLFSLFDTTGLESIMVSPRVVYSDASRPEMIEGFIHQTFIAMVSGVRDAALEAELITEARWEEAIAGLARTAERDGSFTYSFYKAVGRRP